MMSVSNTPELESRRYIISKESEVQNKNKTKNHEYISKPRKFSKTKIRERKT